MTPASSSPTPFVTLAHETLVLEEGECLVTAWQLTAVLRIFAPREIVTIEARDNTLQIERFRMPITEYYDEALPPADLQVFPVTDLDVLPESTHGPSIHLDLRRSDRR